MALKEYNKKRVFDKTPEPTGGKAAAGAITFRGSETRRHQAAL